MEGGTLIRGLVLMLLPGWVAAQQGQAPLPGPIAPIGQSVAHKPSQSERVVFAPSRYLDVATLEWPTEPEMVTHRAVTLRENAMKQLPQCAVVREMMRASEQTVLPCRVVTHQAAPGEMTSVRVLGLPPLNIPERETAVDMALDPFGRISGLSSRYDGKVENFAKALSALLKKYGKPSYYLPPGSIMRPPRYSKGSWVFEITDNAGPSQKLEVASAGAIWAGKRNMVYISRYYDNYQANGQVPIAEIGVYAVSTPEEKQHYLRLVERVMADQRQRDEALMRQFK